VGSRGTFAESSQQFAFFQKAGISQRKTGNKTKMLSRSHVGIHMFQKQNPMLWMIIFQGHKKYSILIVTIWACFTHKGIAGESVGGRNWLKS
jgi:hypothetical protein